MEGKRLIEKIRLRNILSFGDKGEEIELQPLNVLIGQNASGKSNFIDVIKLLRTMPQENGMASFISRNGGVSDWIWKGKKTEDIARIEIVTQGTKSKSSLEVAPIKYKVGISSTNFRAEISEEVIELENKKNIEDNDVIWFYRNINGKSLVATRTYTQKDLSFIEVYKSAKAKAGLPIEIEEISLPSNDSVLSQIKDLINHPEISFLGTNLRQARIYTELNTHRYSEIRKPQLADAPIEFLEENGLNLNLVLNNLEFAKNTKAILIENLKKFAPRFQDFLFNVFGGSVQLFFREENLENPISAFRLSNGTIQYLCLLAILCHPEPPPLICIEEPETGLHPDILPTIGELLIEASKRTQLIVTTHSDILVSSFSEVPEAVLVCEADEDGTHLNRLDGEKLKGWLKKYQLGDLWIRGEIGGTRW